MCKYNVAKVVLKTFNVYFFKIYLILFYKSNTFKGRGKSFPIHLPWYYLNCTNISKCIYKKYNIKVVTGICFKLCFFIIHFLFNLPSSKHYGLCIILFENKNLPFDAAYTEKLLIHIKQLPISNYNFKWVSSVEINNL